MSNILLHSCAANRSVALDIMSQEAEKKEPAAAGDEGVLWLNEFACP